MFGLVLQNNTKFKVLEIRNMIDKGRDMNDIWDNIRDEIFIFFNYLFAEDSWERCQARPQTIT